MTTKFHVTEDGARPCKATVKPCPLGGENIHFASQEEAQAAYEAKMAEEHGVVASQKKATETDLGAMGWHERAELARKTDDAVLLARLAEDDEEDVRWSVARNEKTPPEVLAALAEDEYFLVPCGVAKNTSTPVEVLERLAKSDDARYVAENKSTPVELLEALAGDDEEDVRASVAANEKTPPEVLAALAEDDSEDVRLKVAENEHTPVEVLERLAGSDDEDVQAAVARHPNVTTELLDRMADNCGDEKYKMQSAVAQNPKTSGDTLGDLAESPFGEVREAALRHRNFPTDILFSMQFDEDWGFEQDDVEDRIIQNLTEYGQWEKKNMQELFDAARGDGLAFKTEEAFREAYDYTYGEGGMGNPMLAANIFAEPREN
ncbi:HEAT repeat domain-containing protein [Schaalia suimastitidis]|uniref:variant leucine-rich repeat-containing protein n=1 Tax=Schaalia suimastitidis TaxID=121163 RepID=UPI0003F6E61A|nr:HEAT repeat domain-containing protein [Schaalia suimastitidis]